MAKVTQGKARNQKEWWDSMREECEAHNSDAHVDDQVELNVWPERYVGTTVYGFSVTANPGSYTGYYLTAER